MPHFRHNGVAYKQVTAAARHDGSVWANIIGKWRHNGVAWKQYFDPVGGGVFTVQITPSAPEGVCFVEYDPETGTTIGCAPFANASAVVTGGTGPFTYAWTREPGGDGTNFLSGAELALPDVEFNRPMGRSQNVQTQTWKCTVTDTDDMSTANDICVVVLERS